MLVFALPGIVWGDERQGVFALVTGTPGRPLSMAIHEGIQSSLHAADSRIALSEEFLRLYGPEEQDLAKKQLQWYLEKYRKLKFDVLIAAGFPAFEALLSIRNQLGDNLPIVFCVVPPEAAARIGPRPNVTGLIFDPNFPYSLRIARQILPSTRRLAIVGGASAFDRVEDEQLRPVIRAMAPDLEVIDLTKLALPELKRRVKSLPGHTVVIVDSYLFDPSGQPVYSRDLIPLLTSASNAPVFDVVDFGFGYGIVGGALRHYQTIGSEAAALALRILRGEKASSIPITHSSLGAPRFDWRQLKKWKIPESRLPPGSIVEFREFSLWERYGAWLAGIFAFVVVESMLIAFLLFERSYRKRAEREARESRDQISHLNRIGSMGELAASLAHELNQPLSGILSNAQAARRLIAATPPDLAEVDAALQDIQEDNIRAGNVIRGMRNFLRKRPREAAKIDLNEIASDTTGLLRPDAHLRGVIITLDLAPQRVLVNADAVQLQQVVLNLVINAMEAVSHTSRDRHVVIRTASEKPWEQLFVVDSGPGIPKDTIDRVFQPFFTTKVEGLGMGLSISRSIVESYGGRISVESSQEGGAIFCVLLPSG